MITRIFGLHDSTIYEQEPTKNTGLDSVLDLSKTFYGTASVANNRALLKFNLTTVSQSVGSGAISNAKYFLNLYTVDAQEIPSSYKIEVYPVSQSWEPGIGKYNQKPITTYGVSWNNRSSTSVGSTKWTTSSFAANTTGSYTLNPGGATWYTNYVCSQSYDFSTTDIRVDVTSIVEDWLDGTIPNNGFVIKKSFADESSTDSYTSLKYFSSDTHTIYQPSLEIAWDNAVYTTGSLTQPSSQKEFTVFIRNLKKAYNQSTKTRFEIGVREKYPVITFATQSNYLISNYLPSSSFFYSIQHADTNETVIPFDTTYTKVSCTSSGNFVDLWLNGLYPETYYKMVFKVNRDGAEEYIDNNFIFKIVK